MFPPHPQQQEREKREAEAEAARQAQAKKEGWIDDLIQSTIPAWKKTMAEETRRKSEAEAKAAAETATLSFGAPKPKAPDNSKPQVRLY